MSADLEIVEHPRSEGTPLAPPGTSRADPMPGVVTDELLGTLNPVVQFLELVTTCTEDLRSLEHFRAELNKYPLDITAGPQIFDNRTPLHLAACHGKLEIAKLIMASPRISAQVVNAKDHYGYTPLHLAAGSGELEIAKLIMASPRISAQVVNAKDHRGYTPLHLAAGSGELEIAKLIMASPGISAQVVNAKDHRGYTPLHLAAGSGELEIVKLIMASPGISAQVVNAKDHRGYTPLHLAVASERVDIVRLLTSSSLTSRSSATASELDDEGDDRGGLTPLHLAARVGNIAIAKLLLDCQDKRKLLHATDWNGMTALDVAKMQENINLVELLECCDVMWLEQERQKSANSVNAILVGAALVASMAFGSLLQPPLFVSNQYNALTTPGSPAPGPSHKHIRVSAGVYLLIMVISFTCSVASLTTGTSGVLPKPGISLKQEVEDLRISVRTAANYLSMAIYSLTLAYYYGTGILFGVVVDRAWDLVTCLVMMTFLAGVGIRFVFCRSKEARKEWTESEESLIKIAWIVLWAGSLPIFLSTSLLMHYSY